MPCQRSTPQWMSYIVKTKLWRKTYFTSNSTSRRLSLQMRHKSLIPGLSHKRSRKHLSLKISSLSPWQSLIDVETLMSTPPPSPCRCPSLEHPIHKMQVLFVCFRGTSQRWYIGLLQSSISSYQDLVKKLVHQSA